MCGGMTSGVGHRTGVGSAAMAGEGAHAGIPCMIADGDQEDEDERPGVYRCKGEDGVGESNRRE